MATANYPMASEVRVTRSEAETMMQDPSFVVILATEDEPDLMTVTFWPNEKGQMPPWLRPKQAV